MFFFVLKKTKSSQTHIYAVMDSQLINIVLLGVVFMILFIEFQTTSMLSVLYHFEFYQRIVWNLLLFLLAKCIGRNEE
jgi:hypothetical protein